MNEGIMWMLERSDKREFLNRQLELMSKEMDLDRFIKFAKLCGKTYDDFATAIADYKSFVELYA